MKLTAVLRATAWSLLLTVATSLVVLLAVYAFLASRPAQYQARVALVAVPATTSSSVDFGTVVGLTLASVSEVASSSTVLDAARQDVPGAPPATELAGAVGVDLVPDSGVARITLTARSAQQASLLAQAVGRQVVAANLLAPAGTFRVIDTALPQARQTAPDRTLALGFALVAAVVAGGAALFAGTLARPTLVSRRQVSRLVDDPEVAVLAVERSHDMRMLRELQGGSGARSVAAGRAAESAADAVRGTLDPDRAHPPASGQPVVVVVRRGTTSPQDLRTTLALVRASSEPLLAVAVV